MTKLKKRPNMPGFIHPKFGTPQDCLNSLRDVRDLDSRETELCVAGIETDDKVSLAAYTRGFAKLAKHVPSASERFVKAIIAGGDKQTIYTAMLYSPSAGKERADLTEAYRKLLGD